MVPKNKEWIKINKKKLVLEIVKNKFFFLNFSKKFNFFLKKKVKKYLFFQIFFKKIL